LRRTSIHHSTYPSPMGLAPSGHAIEMAESICHASILPEKCRFPKPWN